ncbi:uncharacterized protein LOC128960582 [Oppia nitens]|uniref:uncharacterized protein LOC128960582 n=1 Tax=Oppia nitens TaxID=1686743 RepID=UPI0023DC6F54|nr:uncharacterized protein LOC128960582 [Oppia nitens]
MKLTLLSTLAILFGVQICQISANQRNKRQTSTTATNYEFPGIRKAQYEELIEQYDPVARVAAAQTYSPSISDPQDYSGQYSPSSSYRSTSGSAAPTRSRAPVYRSSSSDSNNKDDDEAKRLAEEEEDKKPDKLALLLQDSKFSCGDKKDGYYADESVGCQVFHYCVGGAKHSWMCPENTVFHQIHLNCVPAAQDICTQSSKYHVVNDYLYKPLEQRGPNNTLRYHQRYYPEGFDFGGDVLSQVLPPSQPQRPAASPYNYRDDDDSYEPRGNTRSQSDSYPSSYQSYPASAPARAAQPVSRPVYKQQAVARAPASPQTYSSPSYSTISQPKPTARPSTYSTPSLYSSSFSSDSDSDSYDSYPSSGSSFTSRDTSGDYTPSGNSYSSPTSSYPSSQYAGSLSSSSYPSSASSSGGSSATLSSYRPVQSAAKPVSYPSRSLGIPIASFRVAAASAPSSNYGSSAQASRVRSAAYAPTGFSLGTFNSEMASGVKYDEDY